MPDDAPTKYDGWQPACLSEHLVQPRTPLAFPLVP